MILVTKEQLKKISPVTKDLTIDLFLPYINQYSAQYEVNTQERMASFLAQVLHESGGFKYTREIWGPTNQQKKYERDIRQSWKPGLKPGERNYLSYMLGNSEPGDGKLFKGHGLLQITGRRNTLACSLALFGDNRLLRRPDLLSTPMYAVQSAFWYWKSRNINKAADTPGIEDETRLVNGGKIGIEQRSGIFDIAINVLTV